MDPEKTSAIENWPVPKNKKQIRSFLGFCSYYRKFVKGFSSQAKLLFKLTENHTKFWTNSSSQEAIVTLKQALISSPVLSFPTEEKEFILDTDASIMELMQFCLKNNRVKKKSSLILVEY